MFERPIAFDMPKYTSVPDYRPGPEPEPEHDDEHDRDTRPPVNDNVPISQPVKESPAPTTEVEEEFIEVNPEEKEEDDDDNMGLIIVISIVSVISICVIIAVCFYLLRRNSQQDANGDAQGKNADRYKVAAINPDEISPNQNTDRSAPPTDRSAPQTDR